MLITEVVAEIQRGNVQALVTLRRAFDLLAISDVFQTNDVRDEMALAQTIGLMHRVERRLKARQVMPDNLRHAAIETIDEVMQA